MAQNEQYIEKKYSKFEVAKQYYTILFSVNNLPISNKEVCLVAFSAVNGTISTPPVRDEFIKQFHSSRNGVYNITAKLIKLGIFVKINNKIRVNPHILPDFSVPFIFHIKLINNENLRENRETDS